MADATKIFSLLVLDSGPLHVLHLHDLYVLVGFLGCSKFSLYVHFTRWELCSMGSCLEGTTSFIPLNFRCFFKYFTSLRSSMIFPFILKLDIMCFSLLFVYLFGPIQIKYKFTLLWYCTYSKWERQRLLGDIYLVLTGPILEHRSESTIQGVHHPKLQII